MLITLGTAAGCTGDVTVSAPTPSGPAASQCRSLLTRLPERVAGQSAQPVDPSNAPAAAWGDPPIVLRCGVGRPVALRANSACFEVNSIGWFAQQDGRPFTGDEQVTDELVFTTIGRTPYVEVRVPPAYQPAADALVDVSSAVSSATKELHPCV